MTQPAKNKLTTATAALSVRAPNIRGRIVRGLAHGIASAPAYGSRGNIRRSDGRVFDSCAAFGDAGRVSKWPGCVAACGSV
jgi:hypothetical protein